jgi:photosystem II stability/assembly factor-like uncharacterized protein
MTASESRISFCFIRLTLVALIISPLGLLPSAHAVNSQNMTAPVRDTALLRPGTGWALAGQHLLWTSDNGATWRDLAPVDLSRNSIDGAFFLDPLRGWIVFASRTSSPQEERSVSVASTTDGGQHWQTHVVMTSQLGKYAPYSGESSIFFVDQWHGWLTTRLASSSNFSIGHLFATEDGGQTWFSLPDPPSADRVFFTSDSHGWLAGGPGGDRLWTSQNGGQSWSEQRLTAPPECPGCKLVYQSPHFSSATEGVLPVLVQSQFALLRATYVTHDGGNSWASKDVVSQGAPEHSGVSVIAGTHVTR